MAKYYCVLFDADNTLLNFDAAESKALAETLVNYGIEPDAETVQTYRTINSELWRQLEKGQLKREKLMAERFTRFLKAIDAAGDGAEMNRFYLEQLSTHPDLMGPEVLDVLRELSEVATLAVVTNGFQKVQTRRLAESGVLNFMEDVFVSEKMDSEKPNRRIFDAALRALGVENREHVLMVGDGLSSDIQGGVNAGLDTCWYNPSHAENPGKVVPTYEIADLKELYPLVMEQEELANVGLIGAGDWLVERGLVLLHDPSRGIAFPTKNPVKEYTKAQKEFLYDYYMERDCKKEANAIWKESDKR